MTLGCERVGMNAGSNEAVLELRQGLCKPCSHFERHGPATLVLVCIYEASS